MDIQLEKKKGIQKKHIPYIAGGAVILALLVWIIFGNHASTLRIDGDAPQRTSATHFYRAAQPRRRRHRAGKSSRGRRAREERRRHPPPEQLEPRPADIERRIGTRRKTKPFA